MPDDTLSLLLADLALLSVSVNLDRQTDPRRVLPAIPATLLWRILPRIMRRAALLGRDTLPAHKLEFMTRQAKAIECCEPAAEVEY